MAGWDGTGINSANSAISVTTLSAISPNLGTVTAGTLQDSAGYFAINLTATTQTIKDGSGHTRVLVGNLGGDYGIQVFNSTGAKIFDASQGAWDAASNQPVTTIANTANTSANTAVGQVTQLPVINGGFDIAPTGYGWVADSGTWFTDTTSISPGVQPNCARRNGNSTTPTDVYRNIGRMGVDVGQIVRAQGLIKAVGADGNCAVRISWLDANQAEITTTQGNTVTGTTTAGSYVVGTAPANARYARVEVVANSNTVGYYLVDNVLVTQYPKNISEVPNGGGHNSVTAIDGNGLALIDFTQSGHVSKNLDNIADGTTYARIKSIGQLGGLPIGSGVGRNLVSNGGFELNTSGGVTITPSNSGGVLCDNWTATVPTSGGASPSNAAQRSGYRPRTGAWCLQLTMVGSTVPANTAQYGPTANYAGPLDFTGVSKILMQASVFWDASGSGIGAASGFAGLTLEFTDSTGAATGYAQLYRATAGDSGYISTVTAVPAGTVSAKLHANCYINNTTASPIAVTGYPIILVVDDLSIYAISNLDTDVIDGTTYARIYGSDLSGGRHKLTVAGSGSVLGNQLNAPNSLTLNYGAARTATAVTASSTGAVSINAFSVNMGGTTVSYNAVSNAVTGLTVGSTYQIYCHDIGGTGGTKTWLAYLGTSTGLLTLGDDVVLAGQVTIPSSGTSGGGWAGTCVCDDMFIDDSRTAGDARPGDVFDCLDLPTTGMRKFRRRLHSVEYDTVPCVRITTDAGAILECSLTTPFDVLDGRTVYAPDLLGEQVVTDQGIETVARVDDIGIRRVCHIHLGGVSYAAGADPSHRIYSHNLLKP